MPKKYIFILFIVLLIASDSLWACAESLMPQNQHDDTRLRKLTPSSQDMLSIASLIAYASESQTVSANHIIMAILTRVESSNKEINRLHFTDIDGHLNFNSLVITLKEFNILREVQEFLLSQLNVQVHNPILFELRDNDLLILHLEDISFIPALDYDESANALLEKVIIMKKNVEKANATYPISIDHFFLEALRMDTSHFVSELLNKPHIEIVEDFSHKIKQARQTLLSVSKRKKPYYSQETKNRAVQLVRQIGNVKKVVEILNINPGILYPWVYEDKKQKNKPVRSQKKYTLEQRDEVVQLAYMLGNKKVAGRLGIPVASVEEWVQQFQSRQNYTLREKEDVVRLVLKKGYAMASKQLEIPMATLLAIVEGWVQQSQSKRNYTLKERENAVRLARRVGGVGGKKLRVNSKKVMEQLGILLVAEGYRVQEDRKKKNEIIKRHYTLEQKDKAVQLVRKEGYAMASKQLEIPMATLLAIVEGWIQQSQSKRNYTLKERENAVRLARRVGGKRTKVGSKKVMEQLGILLVAEGYRVQEDKKKKNEILKRHYTPEQKDKAVQLVRKEGYAMASKQLEIPIATLLAIVEGWVQQSQSKRNYTLKERENAVRLARRVGDKRTKVGSKKVREQLGILLVAEGYQVQEDKKKKNEILKRHYTLEQKDKAVQLVRKEGYAMASKQLEIPVATLEEWVQQSQSKRNYTLKERENAVRLARREGYEKVAERLGIPPTIVQEWLLQYYKNNPL